MLKAKTVEVVVAHCERCGHDWRPAKMRSLNDMKNEPRWCPACNSPYWNKKVSKPGTSKAQRAKNHKKK